MIVPLNYLTGVQVQRTHPGLGNHLERTFGKSRAETEQKTVRNRPEI